MNAKPFDIRRQFSECTRSMWRLSRRQRNDPAEGGGRAMVCPNASFVCARVRQVELEAWGRLWRDQRRRCHIQPQAREGETAGPSRKVPVLSTSSLGDAPKDTLKGFLCWPENVADIINHKSYSKTFSVTALLSESSCSPGRVFPSSIRKGDHQQLHTCRET